MMKSEEYEVLKLEQQKPTLKSNNKSSDDDAKVVMTTKEQKITSLWKKQREKLSEEQLRLERIQVGERKRAALIDRVQPWRWLEMEAGRVVTEVLERAVMLAIQRKESKMQESKTRLQKEQQAKSRRKQRKSWSWITIEARKVIVELVAEVERQGRVKIGERKKKELIQRIFGEQGHPILSITKLFCTLNH